MNRHVYSCYSRLIRLRVLRAVFVLAYARVRRRGLPYGLAQVLCEVRRFALPYGLSNLLNDLVARMYDDGVDRTLTLERRLCEGVLGSLWTSVELTVAVDSDGFV